MVLIAVFIRSKHRRTRSRFHADNLASLANVRVGRRRGPITKLVQQLVSFEPLVIAVAGFYTVDEFELILGLIAAENVLFCDVRRLNT